MGLLATHTRGLVARVLVLAALAAAVAGCGDNDDDDGAAATTRTKSPAPTATETRSSTAAPGAQGWERIAPHGDCQCADGSEFSFWVREADPKKLVLYLHIGNTATEYAPGLTVQRKAYVNGTAALHHLAATFPDATDVVVIGESAGSIPAPLYAALVSDRLPHARITVLADSSGAYPDAPRFKEKITAWGFGDVVPAWPGNAGLTGDQWSFPGFFIQSARHDPDIVFARHDYAYDQEQGSRFSLVGIPARDLLSRIDANEAQIEDAGVDLLSYTAPATSTPC
jgi:hypothetical protein